MSIHYDLYENPPQEEDGKETQTLHARVVPSGTYTTKDFVERVAALHHLPHAQLIGAIDAITDELQTLLARGYIVEFGDLGHFSLSLSVAREITDRKEIRSPSVRLKNIHLKVKKTFKKELNARMNLERVSSPTRSSHGTDEGRCRQLLLEFLEQHPCINRADYCRLVGVNKMCALRHLNSFIQAGIIRKYGSGKSVVYIRG